MHRRILPILTPAQEMLEVRLLTIRQGQMDAFRAQALAGFEKQIVGHCRTFSPDLCRVLDEAQLELVVRQSMSGARRFGITHRGPVRLFTEMVFLFGSDFPNDPQYSWAGDILASEKYGTQMQKAIKLHRQTLAYHEIVAGPADSFAHAALVRTRAFSAAPMAFSQVHIRSEMLELACHIYPQKAAYVGTQGLQQVIDAALTSAHSHDLHEARHKALLAMLMLSFGCGCLRDPLYPWIESTLTDRRIQSSTHRAARLERKALTWLNSVLSRADKNVSP